MKTGVGRGSPKNGSQRWRWGAVLSASLATVLSLTGCNATLPEPDSEGAQLYRNRCDTCHRIYAPGILKFEMWKFQVERMQGEMVRRGLPPLTPAERGVLLEYLQRHSG